MPSVSGNGKLQQHTIGATERVESDFPYLTTAVYPENRTGGLLLCGINPGRSAKDSELDRQGLDRHAARKCFFSDRFINGCPFNDAITKWFRIWDVSLHRDEKSAGSLERSIAQTNWIHAPSRRADDLKITTRICIENADPFLATCAQLSPRLVMLFGTDLREAFRSCELRDPVEALFGTGEFEPIALRVDGVKFFNIGRFRYERATVLSLPHPTPPGPPPSDRFIAGQIAVRNEIVDWWEDHQKLFA